MKMLKAPQQRAHSFQYQGAHEWGATEESHASRQRPKDQRTGFPKRVNYVRNNYLSTKWPEVWLAHLKMLGNLFIGRGQVLAVAAPSTQEMTLVTFASVDRKAMYRRRMRTGRLTKGRRTRQPLPYFALAPPCRSSSSPELAQQIYGHRALPLVPKQTHYISTKAIF